MKQQDKLNRISQLLARFAEQVKILNSNGEFSINIHAENILIKVLNEVYDCNLENVNYVEGKTYPSIDLRDNYKKIAFQITSTPNLGKITHTLTKFIENDIYKKYNNIYVFIITEKQKKYDQAKIDKIVNEKFIFTSNNIIDKTDLYKELNKQNNSDKIDSVCKLLEEQFADNKVEEDTFFESSFASKYDTPLFLEKNNDENSVKVKLSDVYVEQDYDFVSMSYSTSKKKDNLLELIQNFSAINNNNQCVMIVIANAGMGKSCLLQKLAFEKNVIFGENRRVFALSFCELGELTLQTSKKPILNICKKLNIKEVELNNSVLLLDACDEIQMSDDSLRKKPYIVSLFNALKSYPKLKVIITSRPNYINPKHYPNSAIIIQLKPFDIERINNWINLYNAIQHKEKIDTALRDTLCNPENDDLIKNFYGVPLFLYMIVKTQARVFEPYIGYRIKEADSFAGFLGSEMGRNIASMFKLKRYAASSKYKLYDDLFGIQGIQRIAYDDKHSVFINNWEPLYILLMKIAYYMFSNNNSQNISSNQIGKIIDESNNDFIRLSSRGYSFNYDNPMLYSLELNDFKYLMMQYYGVSCHFNSENNGLLKFIHPSIADFYCAQYLYEMFFWFKSLETFTREQCKIKIDELISEINGIITTEIQDFLLQKIEKDNYFGLSNKNRDFLESIMLDYLDYLSNIYPVKDYSRKYALVFNVISTVLSGITNEIVLPFMDSIERVRFFQENQNALELFKIFSKKNWDIGLFLAKYDFKYIDLTSAIFTDSDLTGCNFSNAILDDTQLTNALLYRATLDNCSIKNSNLNHAKVVNTLSKKCQIINSDLTGADFTGSKLVGAILADSNLSNAVLSFTDMRFANLTGTKSIDSTILDKDSDCGDSHNQHSFKLAFGGSTAITLSNIKHFAHHRKFGKLSIYTNDGMKIASIEEQIQEYESILGLHNKELMNIYLDAINYSKDGYSYMGKAIKLANYLYEKQDISVNSLQDLAIELSNMLNPDYENSLYFHNLSLEVAESSKDKDVSIEANILKNIGDVLCKMEQFSESAEKYESAKTLFTSLSNRFDDELIDLLCSLSEVYYKNGNSALAEERLNELCNIYDNCDDTQFDFNIDNAIAKQYCNLNLHEKAKHWFEKALDKIVGNDRKSKKARAMMTANYGHLFTKEMGDSYNFEEALKYYNDSLNIYKLFAPFHPDTAEIYHKIAAVHYDEQNYNEALNNLVYAISIYFDNINIDYMDSFKKTYELAEEIYPKIANYSNKDLLYNIGKKYLDETLKLYENQTKKEDKEMLEHFLILAFSFIYYSKEQIDDEIIRLLSMLEEVHCDKVNSEKKFSIQFVPWLIFEISNVYTNLAKIHLNLEKIDYFSNFSIQYLNFVLSQNGLEDEYYQRLWAEIYSILAKFSDKIEADSFFSDILKESVQTFQKFALLLKGTKYMDDYAYFSMISKLVHSVSTKEDIPKEDFDYPEDLIVQSVRKFFSLGMEDDDNIDNSTSRELSSVTTQAEVDIDPLDKLPNTHGVVEVFPRMARALEYSIMKNGRQMLHRLTGELYSKNSDGGVLTIKGGSFSFRH